MTRDTHPHGEDVAASGPTSTSGSPSTLVDGLLDEDRDALGDVSPALVDELFGRVAEDTLDRTPTLRDRLRELATPARVAVATFAAIGFAATMLAVLGTRSDLDAEGLAWLVGVHLFVLLGSIGGLVLALRPSHRRPLNSLAWLAVAGLFLAPVVMAVIPGLIPGIGGTVPTLGHLMCGGGGVLVALPATVVVLLLDRSSEPAAWRVLLASGAAGLLAFGFGHWHCPMVDPVHLIVAHGLLGAGIGVVALGLVRLVGWVRVYS